MTSSTAGGHGQGAPGELKQALLDALYPAKSEPEVPKPDPKDVASLTQYAGPYLSSFACRTCPRSDDQLFQVKVGSDGTLSLWGQTWLRLRRDLFIRADGKRLLGFARNTGGKVIAVTGGSWRVADKVDDKITQ